MTELDFTAFPEKVIPPEAEKSVHASITTSPFNVNPQFGVDEGETLKELLLTALPVKDTDEDALKVSQASTLRLPEISRPQLGKLLGVRVK